MIDIRLRILYNVLPKKRLFIAFVGFLISSTITAGGSVLMYSIVSSTTSYLGESETVLVITQNGASTPYTSVLPLDFVEAVKYVQGVLAVSPEVMTAAVYKDHAIYIRGVDISSFWAFEQYNIIDGKPLSTEDLYNVSIGKNFAEMNNLKVGETITIYSTHSDAVIDLRVKSIIYTGTLMDDEIIMPLSMAQFLTFKSFNYITHVRVKINPTLITKDQVREIVTKTYPLTVYVSTYNQSTNLNATVYVYDMRGTLINKSEIVNNNYTTFILPFRKYIVYSQIGDLKSNKTYFLTGATTKVNLIVPLLQRYVRFNVTTQEGEPIEKARITIKPLNINDYNKINIKEIFTNANGTASTLLINGSYSAVVAYSHYVQYINFVTYINNSFDVTLIKKYPDISINYPANNSVIFGNKIKVSISASPGYSIYFYLDRSSGSAILYHSEYSNTNPVSYVPYTLPLSNIEGNHTITAICRNHNYNTNSTAYYNATKIYFNVTMTFPDKLNFSHVSDGANLYPNQKLHLSFPYTLFYGFNYSWDNLSNTAWKTASHGIIPVEPDVEGVHNLYIYLSNGVDTKVYSFHFTVSYNHSLIGLYNSSSVRTIKSGLPIKVWYNNVTFPIYYSWDNNSQFLLYKDELIQTTNITRGYHFLSIAAFNGEIWLNKTYSWYFDNDPPSITLNVLNNSEINASVPINFWSNETLSKIYFSWDNISYSRAYYNNSIPVPSLNGNHTLSIIGFDIVGNKMSYNYSFSITNGFNVTNSSYFDFFLSNEYSGILNQTYIDLQINSLTPINTTLIFNISGTVNLSGNYSEYKRYYLYPGNYTLTIYSSENTNINRTWTFQICKIFNKNVFNSSELPVHLVNNTIYFPEFDVFFNINASNNLFISDGIWSIQSGVNSTYLLDSLNVPIIIDTIKPSVDIISPVTGTLTNKVTLIINASTAVEVFYQLNEATAPLCKYEGPTELTNLTNGLHRIIISAYDSAYNKNIFIFTYSVGLDLKLVNLNFVNSKGGAITQAANFTFTVRSIWNNSYTELTTNNNGSAEFYIIKGNFVIFVPYLNEIYSYTLNTETNANDTVILGDVNITLAFYDFYANTPIKWQIVYLYDHYGVRRYSFSTRRGNTTITVRTGIYDCVYHVGNTNYKWKIHVYKNSSFSFVAPSPLSPLDLIFVYDNNSIASNLPLIIHTQTAGDINITTGVDGKREVYLSYQQITIDVYSKSGQLLVSLVRSFYPGIKSIKVVIPSSESNSYNKLPFNYKGGAFEILVSVSAEYMQHYLKGSLLFTYTIAYAEVVLISLIVTVNLYSILRNLHKESKKETSILSMLGGTKSSLFLAIFSRLLVLGTIAAVIGYFLGLLVLKILASYHQTRFFGHTFTPAGNIELFMLNIGFIILAVIISTVFIIIRGTKRNVTLSY